MTTFGLARFSTFTVLACAFAAPALAQQYAATTYAGGAWLHLPALGSSVPVGYPRAVVPDGHGGVYFSSTGLNGVFKVDSAGTLTVVAGNGMPSSWPGNSIATGAIIGSPQGLAVDAAGNLYIADTDASLIRKLDIHGTMTTVAGGGTASPGDGQAATGAQLSSPEDVAVDAAGNLYIADTLNGGRVRKVDTHGVITTLAGAGSLVGSAVNGKPAAQAHFGRPAGLAIDGSGNLYVADAALNYVYRIDSKGIVTVAAGNGTIVSAPDGTPAVNVGLCPQGGLGTDVAGNLYIPDTLTNSIRKVDGQGVLTTVAGSPGSFGFGGDGGLATSAILSSPQDAAPDIGGVLWIADSSNFRVRKVDGAGVIATTAGVSGWGYAGDGGPATSAMLSAASGVALDSAGNLFIADTSNTRIRKVSPAGIITTVAGNGIIGSSGDGGPATGASLFAPSSVAVDVSGNVYVGDLGQVRKIDSTGVIGPELTTAAGRTPAVAVDPAGNLYVADGNIVRKIDPQGNATVVAGAAAGLSNPTGMALDAAGNLYIADQGNARIRMVNPAGAVTTVAGNGAYGYSGDGGLATSAQLWDPAGVAVDYNGDLVIADGGYVRVVDQTGVINTIASGLNGAVAIASFGVRLYVAESNNDVVRVLVPPIPDLVVAVTHASRFTPGQTGAVYAITVGNQGGSPTTDTVTLSDTLPAALAATAMSGAGWTCTLATLTCTRADPLAGNTNYPAITLTVNVAANAPAGVTNIATVSGGGETYTGNDTALDPTSIGLPADLTIAAAHSGSFTQGQTGAVYTLTVANSGTGPTSGTVTLTDTLPAKLTATAIAGTGWTCALATLTCSRTDALAAATDYPAVLLTVNVAADAPASVTNTATVSGGEETNTANDTALDPTTIGLPPDLTVAATHSGSFSQGETGALYTITVGNAGGAATSGAVTLVDTLPAKLTATAMTGPGWTCTPATLTCARADALAAGANYPAIILTVNVAADAPASVTNTAIVSGGGETDTANDTALDPTTIGLPADLTVAATHSGAFIQGQAGAVYTISVGNAGGAATSGTVTVIDTLPAKLAATAIGGTGWTCALATLTCARGDALAAGANYPAITLTVNVAADAPASVTNVAAVSGGGETNTANDTASDPTSVTGPADLAVAGMHAGNFAQSQTGAVYAITVSNAGAASTSGTVTVIDTLPAALTATAINGTGWNCTLATLTCTRSDALAPGANYPAIALTVNVAAAAPASVTNIATVSGGGEVNTANDTASDVTAIAPVLVCTYSVSPALETFPAAGGSASVSVTAPAGCTWSVSSALDWVTVTAPASIAVAPNAGAARSGAITVAGQSVTIQQAAASAPNARFVPVAPCRIADTRAAAGPFGGPSMDAGSTRSFAVPASACAIPATALAYSLNVTVVPQAALPYLTLWPTDQTRPTVSTLNSWQGTVVANAAIVPAGTNGAVSVYAAGPTDVILDIDGYFDASGGPDAYSFYPTQPCRIADTRAAAGAFGGPSFVAGQSRDFAVPSSSCGLPSTATAYSLNVTVVPDPVVHYLGYLTTWPAGQPLPNSSTLNSWTGKVVANAAVVPAGSGGAISVFASNPTDVILDSNGYFAPPGSAGALSFYPVTPCRVADTRNNAGPTMDAGTSRSFSIAGGGCSIPATAAAYSLNVTVVPQGPLSYLTAWPAGSPRPLVSTLNSPDASVVANAAIVPAGTDGAIEVYVTGRTDVILDINGYFAP